MKILYDDNMPFAEDVFPSLGDASAFNHQALADIDLASVDAMMIRSTSKIDQARVGQLSSCQFLATATAGYNHLDLAALSAAKIDTFIAAGCNATSVSEYALSGVLYALLARGDIQASDPVSILQGFRVGVVGLGQVGRRVMAKFSALGMIVDAYDPPRALAENRPEWNDLAAILSCDIICLHAPLVKNGPYPSWHLFDEQVLAQLSPRQILLNAGRGEVVDNHALLRLAQQGLTPTLILDVWEDEPDILTELIEYCLIATPHIAGHSLEGKTRGTFMLYDWLATQTQQAIVHQMADFLPNHDVSLICSDESLTVESLSTLVWTIYDIAFDHSEFVSNMAQSPCFALLRKQYRQPRPNSDIAVRREFDTAHVTCTFEQTTHTLSALGFSAATL